MIMISSNHCFTATIEGNVIDINHIGELEIHAVDHSLTLSYLQRPGLLVIVLYLALTAKTLDIPASNHAE